MAHIPDGVVAVPVLATGALVSAGGLALGLRRLTPERMPRVAVLSAVFFVASLIHLPAGPASVHLMLNGIMGAVLGAAAFPAIVVALVLLSGASLAVAAYFAGTSIVTGQTEQRLSSAASGSRTSMAPPFSSVPVT